jgi:hypothetical protein
MRNPATAESPSLLTKTECGGAPRVEEATLTCRRCRGLLIADYLTDLEDSSESLWLRVWRCVACGEVTERRIVRHRLAQEGRPDSPVEQLRNKARKKYGPLRVGT